MKLDFASLTSLEPALLRRCPENPILTTEDIPYSCKRVYNPAATRLNGRYALVEGEIDVAQLQQGGRNSEQKVMLKIDTTTGQVWVLQLSVNGPNDPTVRSAVWAPVANDGSFNPAGQIQVAPSF